MLREDRFKFVSLGGPVQWSCYWQKNSSPERCDHDSDLTGLTIATCLTDFTGFTLRTDFTGFTFFTGFAGPPIAPLENSAGRLWRSCSHPFSIHPNSLPLNE